MFDNPIGRVLSGDPALVQRAARLFEKQAVDWDLLAEARALPPQRRQATVERPVSIKGPGTFFGKSVRTLTFAPTDMEGWWIERTDLHDNLPVRVSIRNVWTTGAAMVSNIVLRSGSAHNYIRMAEHIIALKMGLGVDNVVVRVDSGDPPLFQRGSSDLVEALVSAGRKETIRPVQYVTVREPVTVGSARGGFLTLAPADPAKLMLAVDCAVDFKTAIGKQRIRFPVDPERFKLGAAARTNTSALKMFFCKTLGLLFADIRNFGYTKDNVLVAGRFCYYNKPQLMHAGKSLEAAWHRAILDLLAAIALIEDGYFVGEITSYKAGHALDVEMIQRIYQEKLLTRL